MKVRSDGAVTLHRPDRERNDGSWETAGMTLPPAVVAEVLDAVRRHRLLGLRQAYHADVHDGSQWVFLFRQGGSSKAVYFDNSFPKAIGRFAEDLDRILAANGLGAVAWRRVPLAEARGHERELWESVRQ